jgi:hypothetical protein
MSDNPLPCGYEHEQVVRDVNGLRVRTTEERTTSGAGIKHNMFVIATPIGVSNAHSSNTPSKAMYIFVHGLT